MTTSNFCCEAGHVRNEDFAFMIKMPMIRPGRALLFLGDNVNEVGLYVAARSHIIGQIRFARSQTILEQPCAKQLAAQPHAVRVDDVGFAIGRYFGYAPFATVPLDIRPGDAVGLSWKTRDATELVQRGLVLRAEGRRTSQRSMASSGYRLK
jgi:hypothetical protein